MDGNGFAADSSPPANRVNHFPDITWFFAEAIVNTQECLYDYPPFQNSWQQSSGDWIGVPGENDTKFPIGIRVGEEALDNLILHQTDS